MKKETYQTIGIIMLAILLMFADSIWNKLFSQVFIGPGISNKGMVMQMGAMTDKTEICASYTIPLTKNTNARIASLTIGQKFELNDNGLSLMPYAGYGYLKWQDFTAYESDPTGKTGIVNMQSFKPIIGIQIGKDSHAGNVYIFSHYCNGFYFGTGLKIYFSKL